MERFSMEPYSAFLVLLLVPCSIIVLMGFGEIMWGVQQIFTPFEAIHDKTHPKHEKAKRLYPFHIGAYGDNYHLPRDPKGAIVFGLVLLALSSYGCYRIISYLMSD